MVLNRGETMKRKRNKESDFYNLLDDSPKRTKVHAQRKFAQGSNVNSPVLTPVKEIEKPERKDVLPEPIDLLPMNRPNTEDFLTFLCFRGTPILPTNLNFFNTASTIQSTIQNSDSNSSPKSNASTSPINTKAIITQNGRPFIAFGVRKRADPIVISKQMERKRRQALALQALRRKYQEQKMAKIRAVTISKLSEKINTTKNVIRTTRSVTKSEGITKKNIEHKDVKVISTKSVKVTRTTIKQPVTSLRSNIKPKMCLRSFRGRFVQRELTVKKRQKKPIHKAKEQKETSSEFSSDDDEPLVRSMRNLKTNVNKPKANGPKLPMKNTPGPKKHSEIKLTRSKLLSNKQLKRDQRTVKRQKILVSQKVLKSPTTRNSILKSKQYTKEVQQKNEKLLKRVKEQKLLQRKNQTTKTMANKNSQEKTQNEESDEDTESSNTEKNKSKTEKKKDIDNTKASSQERKCDKRKVDDVVIKTVESQKQTTRIIKKDCTTTTKSSKTTEQKTVDSSKSKDATTKTNENTKNKETVKVKEVAKPKETLKTKELSTANESTKANELTKVVDPVTHSEQAKTKEPIKATKLNEKSKTTEGTKSNDTNPSVINVVETSVVANKRPTRKTKEAAAIYMEILGHKLVSEDKDDDNISLDSFPELPNVRRTEQRENELKAKISEKTTADKKDKSNLKKCDKIIKNKDNVITKEVNVEQNLKESKSNNGKEVSNESVSESTKVVGKQTTRNSAESVEKKKENERMVLRNSRGKETKKRLTRSTAPLTNPSSSSESEEILPKKCIGKKALKKSKLESDSEQSTTSDVPVEKKTKAKRYTKTKTEQVIDNSFSDSDEEPLSKFTNQKQEPKVTQQKQSNVKDDNVELKNDQKVQVKEELPSYGKPKRECTKRPQNYLTLFSSSDDDDKFFHGFVKTETKITKVYQKEEKCTTHAPPSTDLLSKDIGRRYGKEKVNMSTEQIEKWLKESALAGVGVKTENDEMLKFGEKIPMETSLELPDNIDTDNLKTALLIIKDSDLEKEVKTPSVSFSENESKVPKPDVKPPSNEKKIIFKKEKKETPNVNAFNANNESSVYAFEADTEDSVNTPFRRPSRRPSSATSRSEEDLTKTDDKILVSTIVKFRVPPLLKTEQNKKQEVEELLNIQNVDNNDKAKLIKSKTNIPMVVMCPPSNNTLQKCKIPLLEMKSNVKCTNMNKNFDKHYCENSEDVKYKIPSSPSASSSSSAKLYKRQSSKIRTKLDFCLPINVIEFPNSQCQGQMVEAPVFHPNDKEFQDPLEYIEKIRVQAEKFGICRIVPPSTFKPECKVSDDMRFTAYNQYINKMLYRWGPNFKELMAIKKYLETQNISLTQPPWIGGMEIDLPRLYQTVQSLGGLKEVIEKKKWPKVSELMKIPKSAQDRVTKLDDIYCKYLLPYDTLSPDEREKLFHEVETEWAKKESRSLLRAQQTVNKLNVLSNSDSESEDESEECITKGRNMALNAFYRIARNTMSMWFKNTEPPAQEVEHEFWRHVSNRQNHICVHSGSIDSGNWGYGFAVSKNSPFARHAWNLKVLTNNSGSILRSMGPIMGVTVPTLHVGMVFSACCWYRDPHRLPWIEYLHTGGNKIWYGIPDSMSEKFHKTLMKIAPSYCLNKSLWLPSDTAMVPPNLLLENGVSLCRTVQEPGQFIVIFPKAFTSSISTGYVVSESVYFAPNYWLNTAEDSFEELKINCESSMFCFDRLLLNVVNDTRSNVEVLKQITPLINRLCLKETKERKILKELGIEESERLPLNDGTKKKKKIKEDGEYECEVCNKNLYLSLIAVDNINYCLEHAIEMINTQKLDVKSCKLLFTYDMKEINNLEDRLKLNIENKLQKKFPSKFAGMPTLLK